MDSKSSEPLPPPFPSLPEKPAEALIFHGWPTRDMLLTVLAGMAMLVGTFEKFKGLVEQRRLHLVASRSTMRMVAEVWRSRWGSKAFRQLNRGSPLNRATGRANQDSNVLINRSLHQSHAPSSLRKPTCSRFIIPCTIFDDKFIKFASQIYPRDSITRKTT